MTIMNNHRHTPRHTQPRNPMPWTRTPNPESPLKWRWWWQWQSHRTKRQTPYILRQNGTVAVSHPLISTYIIYDSSMVLHGRTRMSYSRDDARHISISIPYPRMLRIPGFPGWRFWGWRLVMVMIPLFSMSLFVQEFLCWGPGGDL